jgi:hypothetical protein
MEERPDRCGTCRFREPKYVVREDGLIRTPSQPDGISEADLEEGCETTGRCHRYPPSDNLLGFPEVFRYEWCGEWQAKTGQMTAPES